jgi:excinuclease ABC subunit A
MRKLPEAIKVRGARTNNLRSVDVDVPLWSVVMVTGVSGSGKSSLAMGVLYAEGSRRFLDALSPYTRNRIEGKASRPDADRIEDVPAALALRQRPPIPDRRSTVGTMTETLNVLRLMMSRLGTHLCPNGHPNQTTLTAIAAASDADTGALTCPVCHVTFRFPSAESFSFNSYGACPECGGIGAVDEIDESTLIPDESRSIDDGAVAPWRLAGRSFMPNVVAQLGIRTDIPYRDLTPKEQDFILHGPSQHTEVALPGRSGRTFRLNAEYVNATRAVAEAGETTRTRLGRFYTTRTCPVCHGTRFRPETLASELDGRSIAQITALELDEVRDFAAALPAKLPTELHDLARRLTGELLDGVGPLLKLGLDYLTLDRAGNTLSTGERQRIELTATVHARSTGALYVLDEPSVGLHPANMDGLIETVGQLADHGNTVVVVDHHLPLMRAADQIIELGPGAGSDGGQVIAQGTAAELARDPASVTGPFLAGTEPLRVRDLRPVTKQTGHIELTVNQLHTLRDLTAAIPCNRLTLITGVSGSGKSTLILDSLVPALRDTLAGRPLPEHVGHLRAPGVTRVVQIDANPIGANARSTPATYCGAFDPIRSRYARESGLKAGQFSYNTAEGQCPVCHGLGELALDIQYLPDLIVRCHECGGRRYNKETLRVTVDGKSIADVLAMTVDEAAQHFHAHGAIRRPLVALQEVGLGYLTLGEPTPALSGGEAQRLRLSTGLHTDQPGTVYVFDEPSVGLHPRDIQRLVGTLDRLLDTQATVIVIDHDLGLIANADHIIDLGPGGGPRGGKIVATGTPDQVAADSHSATGRALRDATGRLSFNSWIARSWGRSRPTRRRAGQRKTCVAGSSPARPAPPSGENARAAARTRTARPSTWKAPASPAPARAARSPASTRYPCCSCTPTARSRPRTTRRTGSSRHQSPRPTSPRTRTPPKSARNNASSGSPAAWKSWTSG